MGLVYADITLINNTDLINAKRHIIGDEEVHKMTISMLVDNGAYMMAINETIQEQLNLPFIEKRRTILANRSVQEYDVVGPIMVKFANRTATCSALVLPGDCEPLLGAIPMEEMDVIIHPHRQELVVNPEHPYGAQLSLKKLSA
jgi:clan AA aspartic protease